MTKASLIGPISFFVFLAACVTGSLFGGCDEPAFSQTATVALGASTNLGLGNPDGATPNGTTHKLIIAEGTSSSIDTGTAQANWIQETIKANAKDVYFPDTHVGDLAVPEDIANGAWSGFNEFALAQSAAGNTVYIMSGRAPMAFWRIALILQPGRAAYNNNPSYVKGESTRVIALWFPTNGTAKSADWKTYRVAPQKIKDATGYDLFGNFGPSKDTFLSAVDTEK